MDGANPLLVKVYGTNMSVCVCVWLIRRKVSHACDTGCYGLPVHMGYDATLQPLLRRGWILAFCHVRQVPVAWSHNHMTRVFFFGCRGGGELGRKWYLQASGSCKQRSAQVSTSDVCRLCFSGLS